MNEKIIQEVLRKKRELEQKKQELAKVQGKLEQLYSQVNNQFGCDSIESIKNNLKTTEEEIEKAIKLLNQLTQEWEKKYDE